MLLTPCWRMSSEGIVLTWAGTSATGTGSRVAVALPAVASTVMAVETRPTASTTSTAGVSGPRDTLRTTVSKPRIANVSSTLPGARPVNWYVPDWSVVVV
jgi:hypothetical protein